MRGGIAQIALVACALCFFVLQTKAQTMRTSGDGVVVRLGQGAQPDKFVEPVPPRQNSRRGEKAGTVEAEITLRPDGWVAAVRRLSASDSSFWMAAESAIKQWHFAPASIKGLGSPARISVAIEFPPPPPHNSGKVLAETGLYQVTTSATQSEWCFQRPDRSQANINIIWKVHADEDVSGATDAYQQRLAEIWREVERHCTPTTSIYVSNYVAGVRLLAHQNEEVAESVVLAAGRSEVPLNNLIAWKEQGTDKIAMREMLDNLKFASLASARKTRQHPTTVALAAAPNLAPAASPRAAATTTPVPAAPRPARPSPPAPPPATVLPPLDLRELAHREMIRDIYLGRFDLVPLADPRNMALLTDHGIVGRKLLASYVETFSDQCSNSLTDDIVQIMRTITTKTQRVNGLGVVVSETETGSRTEDTGIRAERAFGRAYVGITNSAGFETLVSVVRDLGARRSDSLAGATFNLLGEMLEIGTEMRAMISRHGCDSPQIKRFAANALAYVTLQSPPHVFDGFSFHCVAALPTFVPGAAASSCGCVKQVLRRTLSLESFYKLEDDFTEEHFLRSAIAKVGLRNEVAACLR